MCDGIMFSTVFWAFVLAIVVQQKYLKMEFENQIVLLRKKANLDGDWKDEEGDGL